MENELEFAPAWKIRQLVSDGEISPVELTKMFLDRIDSLDSHLNSYLTVTADRALAAAHVAEEAVLNGDAELAKEKQHELTLCEGAIQLTAGLFDPEMAIS